MKHVLQPTRFHNTFGPYEPVLRVADGDTIVTTTLDARGGDQRREQVGQRGNPLTGPFFVEGAKPGDTLRVEIERVWPNREYGYCGTSVASNVVDPTYVPELPKGGLADWQIDCQGGTATLISRQTRLGRLTVPLAPMLGCIGVAPKRRQAISSATSAEHGGNMDYRGYVAGVTAYFPVFEEGALLFVGDGHAVQGDGEIVGTGIEISMDVQITVNVLKGVEIGWPRGENATSIFAVGNARPLDQAVQHATTEMLRWLQTDFALEPEAASILLGQCVDYDVGNMFDPAYTMVCRVAEQLLPPKAPRH